MKNKLTFNIGLKIASVFFAVVLWLVVNSVNNPTVSEPFYDIPVELVNTELITDAGKVYEVLDNTDTISRVTIRAPRTVINAISSDNIIATADVSELSSLDTISIRLTTNVYTDQISSITGSIDTVKLNIEDRKSKSLALKAQVSGEVEDGYLVGDVTTDQNLVRISGAASVVEQVTRAAVEVDVTGLTSDVSTNAEIKLYDADDNQIDTAELTQNIRSVGVKINIYQTAEVPIVYTVTGVPAAGYQETGVIEGDGETVVIAGKTSAIRSVSSIEIPEEVLDISNATEDYVAEVDISDYLPDGVFLANSSDAVKTVTVKIEAETSKRMEIRSETVKITNLPEGYDASISGLEETFIIEAIGLAADVAGLQASAINGVVDIEAWMQDQGMEEPEPGYYTVEIDFGLPDRVYLLEPVTVTLHISRLEEGNE